MYVVSHTRHDLTFTDGWKAFSLLHTIPILAAVEIICARYCWELKDGYPIELPETPRNEAKPSIVKCPDSVSSKFIYLTPSETYVKNFVQYVGGKVTADIIAPGSGLQQFHFYPHDYVQLQDAQNKTPVAHWEFIELASNTHIAYNW